MGDEQRIVSRFAPVKRELPAPLVRSQLGAQRAGDHADAEAPGWIERAALALRAHALTTDGGFIAEAVSMDYQDPPPDKRAWGAAVRFAAARGWIKRIGFTTEGTSNACAKVLWTRGDAA